MKIENYYHTYSKTFVIEGKENEYSHLTEYFDLHDISGIISEIIKKPSEWKKFVNIDSSLIIDSLKLDMEKVEKLKNIFLDVGSNNLDSEIHDQILSAKELSGHFSLLLEKGVANRNYSPEYLIAITLIISSLRAFKLENITRMRKYLFPLIQGTISDRDQLNNQSHTTPIPFITMPILTFYEAGWQNLDKETESFATLSLFTLIMRNNLSTEFTEKFTDIFEGDIFRSKQFEIHLDSAFPCLDIKNKNTINAKILFKALINFCATKLGIFSYQPASSENRKQFDVTEYTSLSGRLLTDNNEILSIPDLRFLDEDMKQDYTNLVKYSQDLLKLMRYKTPDKEYELNETLWSLRKIITRREDDSITFFSRKSNRMVSLASFNDDYPFRSYFRFAILNMLRAEKISVDRVTLLTLNHRLAEIDSLPSRKWGIKSTIRKVGELLNMDANDDFIGDEIPALLELSGINTLSDKLLNQSNILLSLEFYENEERIMKRQLFLSVILSVLTVLLVIFTVLFTFLEMHIFP